MEVIISIAIVKYKLCRVANPILHVSVSFGTLIAIALTKFLHEDLFPIPKLQTLIPNYTSKLYYQISMSKLMYISPIVPVSCPTLHVYPMLHCPIGVTFLSIVP